MTKESQKYRVSSEKMRKGFWKVVDDMNVTQRTFQSKEMALKYADKLNNGFIETISGYHY